MAKMTLSIHAEPLELWIPIFEFVEQRKLHIAYQTFPPYKVILIGGTAMNLNANEGQFPDSLIFSNNRFVFSHNDTSFSQTLFHEQNPNVLNWRIGNISNGVLEQSWLSSICQSQVVERIWRQLFRVLKKISSTGMVLERGGYNCRNERYTKGAKRLYQKGIQWTDLIGHVRYRPGIFDEPANKVPKDYVAREQGEPNAEDLGDPEG